MTNICTVRRSTRWAIILSIGHSWMSGTFQKTVVIWLNAQSFDTHTSAKASCIHWPLGHLAVIGTPHLGDRSNSLPNITVQAPAFVNYRFGHMLWKSISIRQGDPMFNFLKRMHLYSDVFGPFHRTQQGHCRDYGISRGRQCLQTNILLTEMERAFTLWGRFSVWVRPPLRNLSSVHTAFTVVEGYKFNILKQAKEAAWLC